MEMTSKRKRFSIAVERHFNAFGHRAGADSFAFQQMQVKAQRVKIPLNCTT